MSASKRTHRHEKLARIYDQEILPIWSQRFGRLMLRDLELPAKCQVLDVACGTGYPALEVLRKMDEQSRLIAIDASSTMLDVARKKAGDLSGKRVFFRTESVSPKLSFANDVYDVVLCNLGLSEMPDPHLALAEFARVTRPGGQILCTLPLRGTWAEFYDIYNEVLVKHDHHEMLERLEAHIASFPEAEDVDAWMAQAGLTHVRIDVHEFSLLFRSSREFFFAPVIEYGPLADWKTVAGKGRAMQDVFWNIKQAIDAYFGGRAFQVTVKAACARGTKPTEPFAEKVVPTGQIARIDEEEVIEVETGEVELVDDADIEASEAAELEAFQDVIGDDGRATGEDDERE